MRLLIVLLPLLAPCATGAKSGASTSPSRQVARIAATESVVALTGPWKFHIGDNPAWAAPDFDDSNWETQTLPGGFQTEAGEEILGVNNLIPGWAAHGHPHYAGFGWYRIHMQSQAAAAQMALMIGWVDSVYEVYIDGRLVGGFGKVKASPSLVFPFPQVYKLPDNCEWVVAIRMASNPLLAAARFPPTNGGFRQTPLVGPLFPLEQRRQAARDRAIVRNVANVSIDPILLLVGIVALVLYYVSRRKQQEYLWIAVCVLTLTLYDVTVFLEFTTSIAPFSLMGLIVDMSIVPIIYGGLLGQLHLLNMGSDRRFRWVIAGLALLTFACAALVQAFTYWYWLTSPRWMRILPIAWDAVYLLVGLVLLIMAWIALRRRPGRETWIALTPGLAFACFYSIIFLRSQPFLFKFYPIFTQAKLFFEYLIPLAVGYILLYRFISQQKDRDRMRADLQEAQLVQQVLIPEELPQIAGLRIESEYRPAREVGGDFFQIIPDETDGSVLIVVGDVTGKGLQAGMLVALIVGTIRTAVETSFEPLAVLETLNRRLCGRGHAHATGLALRIEFDGSATLANAGHLPPYLNGEELPMEGALPLGMILGAEFSLLQFRLDEGARLLLMSDGVAEAQDKRGQLFGFERIRELLQKPVTVADLADAAQRFGQQDDISVLAVTRTMAKQRAIA